MFFDDHLTYFDSVCDLHLQLKLGWIELLKSPGFTDLHHHSDKRKQSRTGQFVNEHSTATFQMLSEHYIKISMFFSLSLCLWKKYPYFKQTDKLAESNKSFILADLASVPLPHPLPLPPFTIKSEAIIPPHNHMPSRLTQTHSTFSFTVIRIELGHKWDLKKSSGA